MRKKNETATNVAKPTKYCYHFASLLLFEQRAANLNRLELYHNAAVFIGQIKLWFLTGDSNVSSPSSNSL
jgi:hypothetical protein